MLLRVEAEQREEAILSPLASLSSRTRGRQVPEEPCPIRTEYQRDRDRIIHCKAFRRLKHKTQVFIAPEGDHYRTRLTHTLEVAQISRTIARALRLNEDLAEAIALGHDLGHTPFGHSGEEALNEVVPGGFKHNLQSLRVVEVLEGGRGLNLTWEVRDGIAHHTGPVKPQTLEGQIICYADRIAYINHDIDDALRAGIITQERLPADCLKILGRTHRQRIDTMVTDIIRYSWEQGRIAMSPAVQQATDNLRDFLFKNVYIGSPAKVEEGKAKNLLKQLYFYYLEHPEALPAPVHPGDDLARRACDYIAGMTDRYAILQYSRLFVPTGFPS
ncbi:Deoxyguanosinetriphosphate triphosphohydrolase,type 2 [Moorella glycerini]|uniref:Deoxyguanosinetriphosphate triphosphohydrolase-like protein n=1 Tax=Neomoorella stamsii TaxID=1266720 RepID=A0A9X7P7C7_9FIRM|nr:MULTISPECIES: deoxyguanosinetriphosphate triphosphohydrolase [Moorella]PRR76762.1 Deoxyguanosinetriphosphate triphosphohydrolase [Moorella stamsii]CEP66704.1 Deoxyguanosinetriphosphate triphosphohydrolase,type 2 [Moorella glycerini]